MKRRKKGRKIYTYRAKNRRVFSGYHPMRSAVGTILTLVVLAVLGVIGYNIVGPVVIRLREEEASPTTTPEPYFTEMQSAVTTDAVIAEVSETTDTSAETTETTIVTAATTAARPASDRFPADMEVACIASEDVLTDLDALETAAKAYAEQGYTSMILPLKQTGGMLHYASAVEKAVTCGASNDSMLTLREITNAANRYHIQCTALFSTLEDHVYSNYFMEGAYVFTDGTTRWLDDKPEEGGTPWLNPFDNAAADYLSDLAGEIEKSGFTEMICTDTVFPHFFQSDADLLGGQIMDVGRRKEALLSLLNRIAEAAPNSGVYVKLDELAAGTAEAFDTAGLSMQKVFMEIDPYAFEEPFLIGETRFDPGTLEYRDKIELLSKAAQLAAGGRAVIPCLSAHDRSEQEIDTAIAALNQAGFKTVYLF